MKILFLYTELAGYVMSCFKALAATPQSLNPIPNGLNHPMGVEVHVVRWPVNKEAPFAFDSPDGVHIYNRPDYTDELLMKLVNDINPDKIICSGWVDKGYLKVCKAYKGQVPTLLTLDNHWFGNAKQLVMRLLSPFFIRRHFSHAWVPGEPQAAYARKLGFGKRITTGFYSADTAHFQQIYNDKKQLTEVPKRFLYVGRYIAAKGLDLLFEAFMELQNEQASEWELWCLGTGELFDQRPRHPKIQHHGFVQPADMHQYLSETGVFVLPSRFEPWGVVVHEMAVAGFPMICSNAIGSATRFLQDGHNGFIFENENKEALKQALKKTMDMDQLTLKNMSQQSHQLGMQHTPEIWAEKVMGI
ncbi:MULTISPECIES: glycosyltransferase family 4 protein [unclassified Carboxylicivirga]|uniref:glycosyltransferase family 4 protein n=1 Tax=Carboxylicivirga TaxID=1628153 RepID=UPI003D3497F5